MSLLPARGSDAPGTSGIDWADDGIAFHFRRVGHHPAHHHSALPPGVGRVSPRGLLTQRDRRVWVSCVAIPDQPRLDPMQIGWPRWRESRSTRNDGQVNLILSLRPGPFRFFDTTPSYAETDMLLVQQGIPPPKSNTPIILRVIQPGPRRRAAPIMGLSVDEEPTRPDRVGISQPAAHFNRMSRGRCSAPSDACDWPPSHHRGTSEPTPQIDHNRRDAIQKGSM